LQPLVATGDPVLALEGSQRFSYSPSGFVNIIEHRLKWSHLQVKNLKVHENRVDAQVSGDTKICNQQSVNVPDM
jgi:hypothetical protein